jgi:hypothetical protein
MNKKYGLALEGQAVIPIQAGPTASVSTGSRKARGRPTTTYEIELSEKGTFPLFRFDGYIMVLSPLAVPHVMTRPKPVSNLAPKFDEIYEHNKDVKSQIVRDGQRRCRPLVAPWALLSRRFGK